jgi:DNA recombination protein RmuC
MDIIFLLIGLLLGVGLGFFIAKSKKSVDNSVSEEMFQQSVRTLEEKLAKTEDELKSESKMHTSLSEQNKFLLEKLNTHKEEVAQLQEKFSKEFKLLANQIFEEKTQKFTDQNKSNLDLLLNPLRDKIDDFKKKVETSYGEEQKQRVELKTEIKHLLKLNEQLSTEANNLASALKGNTKSQGDWGELQLETLLGSAGLEKDIHYSTQMNFKTQDGDNQRPDMIIHLPEDKSLIIDSKVSLKAYENYFSTNDEAAKERYLKEHIASLRQHLRDLHGKNYQNLYEINSPDYVMMFIPIEPAFALALQSDKNLFSEALDKNIVLVTTSTLLATMRTVSFIWKQENQKKNVLEIARQGGDLYDKFSNFVDDLTKLGTQLETVQKTYSESMKKLVEGKGNLIRRAENLRELGAKTSKLINPKIIERSKDDIE